MLISKSATFATVEREKMVLLFTALRHIDWLSQEEINLIRLASSCHEGYEYSYSELYVLKTILDKIITNTKSSDTKRWSSDMHAAVTDSLDKLK
jgi:hypothetical protein